MKRIRFLLALALVSCLTLVLIASGSAQNGAALAALLLNGDFEGPFYLYGSGQVAENWIPYDLSVVVGSPQFLRSTLHVHDGQASQLIWADRSNFSAGIMQTTALTSARGAARIVAGKRYTASVWIYSIYGGAGSPVLDGKLLKRVGIHPSGGIDPWSSAIIWTPWHGQDKVWIQINCQVEALGNRLTVFIETSDTNTGGQDQFYIDSVSLVEEGAPPPTATPTITPTATPTPPVQVVRTVPVGLQPRGISAFVNANRFFVANSGSDTITRLDATYQWRRTDMPSGGERPSSIAISEDDCRMYVTNSTTDNLAVFNACTAMQVGSVFLGHGRMPDGVAALGNTVFVANQAANTVSIVNGTSLTVTKTLPTGPLPGQIAVNPRTNKVYVTFRGYPLTNDGGVVVIDGLTQTIIKTIGLSLADPIPAPEPYGVSVNPATNMVYVASASGRLVIIDGATDSVDRAVTTPGFVGLDAVAVNPASNNVYASTSTGNWIHVYDATRHAWVYSVMVGMGLGRGIAINPLTYHVLVSNPADNTVSVIGDFGVYMGFRAYLPAVMK